MTTKDQIPLTLIMPVYNSERFIERNVRLAWQWLCEHEPGSELIIIDDSSTDETRTIIRDLREEFDSKLMRVLVNEVNCGKGYSVRKAMLAARGKLRIFTDADLTYPISDVGNVAASLRDGADVAIACRVHEDSRYIVNAAFLSVLLSRHLMGRLFNVVVRLLVVRRLRDTQAGLKGFSDNAARIIFPLQTMNRFSFDVEVLFIASRHDLRVDEVGVEFIYSKEPSTIRFAVDTLKMLRDMLKIRWNSLRGKYQVPA